jgi:DNA-binding transcriptional LysR family regulator
MAYNWKTSSHFWIQMLDLNDIAVFARVVEAGSFTAAARLLGMPKTTVSRRIAALEREVGVRLLQRTTRSLNMTDAGRLYYEQSSQALRTIEDANLRLAEARAEPSGTIRISAPAGFGGHFLASPVFDFLAAYPKTKVELHLTQSGREPDRPCFPHWDSSRLDADRPQARLHA